MERQQQREWERVARQRRVEELSKGSGGPRASHESILCLYSLLGNWGRARAGACSQTDGAVSRGVLGVRWPRRQHGCLLLATTASQQEKSPGKGYRRPPGRVSAMTSWRRNRERAQEAGEARKPAGHSWNLVI